jgi:hypothetical protein
VSPAAEAWDAVSAGLLLKGIRRSAQSAPDNLGIGVPERCGILLSRIYANQVLISL